MKPPRWYVVSLPGGELAIELLGADLLELGAKGMLPQDDRLVAAFPEQVDPSQLFEEIQVRFHALVNEDLLPDGDVEARIVEDEDWVGRWRRSLGPIRAGQRLLIVPPGIDADPTPDDIILLIEPRMGFGTGEHPTTKLALAAIEDFLEPDDRVLDLGCGNGILSIAALLLGARNVTAADFELESVEESVDNAQRHNLSDRLDVHQADVLEWNPPDTPYDLLIANIYLVPILAGVKRWIQWLKPGGRAVFTGVKEGDEEQQLISALQDAGLQIAATQRLDTWACALTEMPARG